MTQRFPPPGFAEVVSAPAPRTLYDCKTDSTVMFRGVPLYLGEFRDGVHSKAAKVEEEGRYALLWGCRADKKAGLPYLILAASRSHQVTAPAEGAHDGG